MAAHHQALRRYPARPWSLTPASVALAAAAALFLLPCVIALAEGSWTTEAGALGPLVLAAGSATLWVRLREVEAPDQPGNLLLAILLLGVSGVVYLAARAINMSPAMCAAGWLAVVAVLYGCRGGRVVRSAWFPLAFLLLVIPLPYTLTVQATALLRNGLADLATRVAQAMGLEVAVNGYAVYVDQYELTIETACAGLSSTASLVAVGLLYAYWIRSAGWKRMTLLAVAAVPVAAAANLARIVMLMLLVHFGGTWTLATPLHPLSGFISFSVALALLLAIDRSAAALGRLARR